MVLTEIEKQQIATALNDDFDRKVKDDPRYTRTRHAKSYGISDSIMSRIKRGDIEGIMSEDKWLDVAIKMGYDITGQGWNITPTLTYATIMAQLESCKERSVARIFCDLIGIGKTTAAKVFARENANVAYVNCKLYRTHQHLVRAIAEAFGFDSRSTFREVRENLIRNIRVTERPIIILDDAGYLKDVALLEAMGLWDETQHLCAWYMIGEPAFRDRLEKMILRKKLGWEGWFNRNGDVILSATDELTEPEVVQMKRIQCEQIIKANYPGAKAELRKELIQDSKLNLRKLRDDINKHKRTEQ